MPHFVSNKNFADMGHFILVKISEIGNCIDLLYFY